MRICPANFNVLFIVNLALLFQMAACGGNESAETAPEEHPHTMTQSSAPDAAFPAERDVCAMLSGRTVQSATGISSPGKQSKSADADICTWSDSGGKVVVVEVFFDADGYEKSLRKFETVLKHIAQRVRMGDDAFYLGGTTLSIPTAIVCARKGNVSFMVQVMGLGQEMEDLRKSAEMLARTMMNKI